MATLTKDKDGWRIRYSLGDGGDRKTLRPGKFNKRTAENITRRLEELVQAKLSACPMNASTAAWLGEIAASPLHRKLSKAGLVDASTTTPSTMTIERLTDVFIARGQTSAGLAAKPQTIKNWQTARAKLLHFFGPDARVQSITFQQADAFNSWMSLPKPDGAGLAIASIRKNVAVCKVLFAFAEIIEAIPEGTNPFKKLKSATVSNSTKRHFVTLDEYETLLKNAPTDEWRLLLSLARFGGLRVPSEVAVLKWSDIDRKRNRFTVTIPKTEHLDGRGIRETPLFPEIVEQLNRLPVRKGKIFAMKLTGGNLTERLKRIMRKAGLTPWPKPWQNMRSTRRTELQNEGIQSHVLNAWFGHSSAVAMQHYLQTTDDDFKRAAQVPARLPARSMRDFSELREAVDLLSPQEMLDLREYIDEKLGAE